MDSLRWRTLLGFDDLFGLALVVAVGIAFVGGVETFDSELDTRRGAVAFLEAGAMILSWSVNCQCLKLTWIHKVSSYVCLLICDARRFDSVGW